MRKRATVMKERMRVMRAAIGAKGKWAIVRDNVVQVWCGLVMPLHYGVACGEGD